MKTAPMAGKSWQPSHEPPRSKRNRYLSHCRNSGKRVGKRVGGELPGRWATTLWNTRERLLYVCHVTLCYSVQSTSMWSSNTCAYVSPPLTSRGTQVLFVVNSIKLHLTAFISNELQPASEDNCFFVRTVSTDHVKSWRKRRGNLDLSQNDLRSQM